MPTFPYRPDVDGLRAVAIGIVLLFHTSLGCPGGYIGVDVFFVISGFLITGLIVKQQYSGDFRLRDFWYRRIRRIMPASAVMVLVVLIAGALLLLPHDYCDLAQSTIAQQLLLANVYFYRTTGYFAGPAGEKPLLHMWSLAVEEQFYVLYPLLLLLVHRYRIAHLWQWLLSLTLISFALSVWGVRSHPNATYYVLPTRAWELLVGGLLCSVPASTKTPRALRELLAVSGAAMILIASVAMDSNTPFPGCNAVFPCIGTALLIYVNTGSLTFVGRLLASTPFVRVGLISYSLYLWHWPILAYCRYWLGDTLPIWTAMCAVAVSCGIAFVSWKYIELPFRSGLKAIPQRRVVLGVCASVPVLVMISVALLVGHGVPGRLGDDVVQVRAARESYGFIHEVSMGDLAARKTPVLGESSGSVRCMLWGDSHAMSLAVGLDEACKSSGVRCVQVTRSSTAPLLDFVSRSRSGLNDLAPAFCRSVVDFAKSERTDIAILAGEWWRYSQSDAFERCLARTIDELTRCNIEVVIVLDVAMFEEDVPLAVSRNMLFNLPGRVEVSARKHYELNRSCNDIIQRCAKGRAIVLDPASCFLDKSGMWPGEVDGTVLYRDKDHLTVEGSRRLKETFNQMLNAMVRRRSLRVGEGEDGMGTTQSVASPSACQ